MIVNRTHATVRGRVIASYPINNTAGGDAVLNFRLAANERQFDPATNTWNDKDTFYVTVSCWDGLARRAAAVALRGQMVVAMGTLVSRNYEKEGQRRSYTELRAQHLAVDLASVETVRNYNGSRAEGSEAPQGESGANASEGSAEDPVGAPDASTSAATEQTHTSPMTSDAAPATPAALSTEAQDSGASERPQYAAASAGGDPMDSGETPF